MSQYIEGSTYDECHRCNSRGKSKKSVCTCFGKETWNDEKNTKYEWICSISSFESWVTKRSRLLCHNYKISSNAVMTIASYRLWLSKVVEDPMKICCPAAEPLHEQQHVQESNEMQSNLPTLMSDITRGDTFLLQCLRHFHQHQTTSLVHHGSSFRSRPQRIG